MPLPWLDPTSPESAFPPARQALKEPNGLLAAGGDLGVQRLLRAYSLGIFPWYSAGEPILWWSPDPRCVFNLDSIHVSRSLQRSLELQDYAVTLDQDFTNIVDACAAPRTSQRGTWLVPEMRAAYRELHARGHAHSIEVWRETRLVGGLYGVSLGNMFFGESMFSHDTDGSKLALVWLARQLLAWGFEFMDCQVGSAHLYRMGATDMSRADFLRNLEKALLRPSRNATWQFDMAVPAEAAHLPERLRAI